MVDQLPSIEQKRQFSLINRQNPDFTGDKYWAKILAERIQKYYHNLGYQKVHVWAEPLKTADSTFSRTWTIQSNIRFSVPKI